VNQIFDLDSIWEFITSPEIIDLILMITTIMMLPLVVAQLHSLLSACYSLIAHRAGKLRLARGLRAETSLVERQIAERESQLAALRAEYDGVGAEHDAVLKALKAFRRAQIREVVCTEVFITNGTPAYSAVVRRNDITPEEEEHDPDMAQAWRKGREWILYAESLSAALIRFDRRFPERGGYEVGPVGVFEIPPGAAQIKAA
jgi:hypothetical protein